MKSPFIRLIALFTVLFSGCSVQDSSSERTQTVKDQKSDSIANTIAEEITGYRVLKQGRQMEEEIRTVSEQHNKDLDAILNEDK